MSKIIKLNINGTTVYSRSEPCNLITYEIFSNKTYDLEDTCGCKSILFDYIKSNNLSESDINELMFAAIENGRLDIVKFLKVCDVDFNSKSDFHLEELQNSNGHRSRYKKINCYGRLAMETAIDNGKFDIMMFLSQNGVNIGNIIRININRYDCIYDPWNCIDDYTEGNYLDSISNRLQEYVNKEKWKRERNIKLVKNALDGDVNAINELNNAMFTPIDSIWILRWIITSDNNNYLDNILFYQVVSFCYVFVKNYISNMYCSEVDQESESNMMDKTIY